MGRQRAFYVVVPVSDGYDTFYNIREGDISLDLEKAGDISWTGKKKTKTKTE